jgi:spore coat protein U-like protein
MRGVRWLVTLAVLAGTLIVAERPATAQWCSFGTTSVAFGAYDVFGTVPLASTGTITYGCWFANTMTIWLSKGMNAPTNTPRQMSNGIDRLNYNLYLDAARTLIWGDPNPSHYDGGQVFWWQSQTVNVYGVIPAGQDVPAGTYTDSVVVTFQF